MLKMYDLAGADDTARFSPFCWRTRMAIALKGLDVEAVAWRFTQKDVIAATGQGAVPVLLHGDRMIHDSWAIAEYLDEAFPDTPKLFESVRDKAHLRFIKTYTERVLMAGVARQIAVDVHDMLDDVDRAYFRSSREAMMGCTLEEFVADADANLPVFRQSLTPLRQTLEAQPFMGGETPSYADCMVFGVFQWVRVSSTRRLLEPSDAIMIWFERMLDLYGGLGRATPAAA